MELVSEAIAFAVKAHDGMRRKKSDAPYILHPMEAAVIVGTMTDDQHLIAAAVLHDVVISGQRSIQRHTPRLQGSYNFFQPFHSGFKVHFLTHRHSLSRVDVTVALATPSAKRMVISSPAVTPFTEDTARLFSSKIAA